MKVTQEKLQVARRMRQANTARQDYLDKLKVDYEKLVADYKKSTPYYTLEEVTERKLMLIDYMRTIDKHKERTDAEILHYVEGEWADLDIDKDLKDRPSRDGID